MWVRKKGKRERTGEMKSRGWIGRLARDQTNGGKKREVGRRTITGG